MAREIRSRERSLQATWSSLPVKSGPDSRAGWLRPGRGKVWGGVGWWLAVVSLVRLQKSRKLSTFPKADTDVGNVAVAFSSPPQLIQGGVVDSECT